MDSQFAQRGGGEPISLADFRHRISIEELALANGYTYNKAHTCRRYPVLDHKATGDRILILNPHQPGNQGYANVRDDFDKGTLVDFVRRRLSTIFSAFNKPGKSEFSAVNAVLYHHLSLPEPQKEALAKLYNARMGDIKDNSQAENAFRADLLDLRPLHDTSYLEGRGIRKDLLKHPLFAGTVLNLHRGTFVNIAFPYNDLQGALIGAEERNYNYKAHTQASRRSSAWHSNPPESLEKVVVTESAIDALSHYQLFKPQNTLYFSTGGNLSQDQVHYMTSYVQSLPNAHLVQYQLGFDRDKEGSKLALRFLLAVTNSLPPATHLVARKETLEVHIPHGVLSPFMEPLLNMLAGNNKPLSHSSVQVLESLAHQDVSGMMFRAERTGDDIKLWIPFNEAAVSFFNRALIISLGMEKRYVTLSAFKKDFNEDLIDSLPHVKKQEVQSRKSKR
ncbi:Protein of unknown function [Cnuella takakiae]|uniref:Toprim-like n=1 Tax=Cnuella takakiae TaxID=1302690 RepID=A0A1M5HQI6_9BACT|nr:toprim domain-containing protein [Cnuella takakiae]OLY95716.1 hypothetical protein BUE76_00405 [Cnuella takakiae]SHG18234.1 Protein of unknown function [Cnuella takakiae]